MKQCSIDGCERKHLARGWCSAHYRRWQLYGDPNEMKQQQHHGLSLMDRLMVWCSKSAGCWEWTGFRDSKGYGRINIGDTPALAHRVSWEVFRSPIPDGMYVLHRCDNPSCMRPEHLFLGDQQMNMDDKMSKKRHRYGVSRGIAHGCSKLTEDQVREIRASVGPSRITAEQYGISGRQVRDIRTLKVWKHLS